MDKGSLESITGVKIIRGWRRFATVVWTYCKACEDIEVGLVNMPKGVRG